MAQLLTPEQLKQISRLRFTQPFESEFWADWAERIRRPVTIIAYAGLALCVLFAGGTLLFMDRSTSEGNITSTLAVLPVLIATLFLVRSRYWSKLNPVTLWAAIGALVISNSNAILSLEQASYDRAVISLWMFFSVIVIGSGLALVRNAVVALAMIIGSYLYLTLAVRHVGSDAMAINLIVITQTVFFALAASYVAEVRARREFLLGRMLDLERHKSEELLLNVLPREIAHRLKDSPGVLAQRHEDASVLFADIVGFTPYAAAREADEVVGFLDDLFTRFDDLIEHKGLEKIKTVGDAYMVAGGVLDRKHDHVREIAELAIEMRDVAREMGVQLRIGVHTGPLVAGVIGRRKFLYDLWGETVNIASRMESHGLPDHVQVSSAVANQLTGAFELHRRGVIEIKGMDAAETFFLVGITGSADVPSA